MDIGKFIKETIFINMSYILEMTPLMDPKQELYGNRAEVDPWAQLPQQHMRKCCAHLLSSVSLGIVQVNEDGPNLRLHLYSLEWTFL